ncbi:hypothetical protein LXA43DRAFT_1035803 [Ganoderma leucocontextum]|nr:hypothetical protein LXA43DRAFT_1035803 [Ganoderma leucocontextum]
MCSFETGQKITYRPHGLLARTCFTKHRTVAAPQRLGEELKLLVVKGPGVRMELHRVLAERAVLNREWLLFVFHELGEVERPVDEFGWRAAGLARLWDTRTAQVVVEWPARWYAEWSRPTEIERSCSSRNAAVASADATLSGPMSLPCANLTHKGSASISCNAGLCARRREQTGAFPLIKPVSRVAQMQQLPPAETQEWAMAVDAGCIDELTGNHMTGQTLFDHVPRSWYDVEGLGSPAATLPLLWTSGQFALRSPSTTSTAPATSNIYSTYLGGINLWTPAFVRRPEPILTELRMRLGCLARIAC